jgi:DNA-binding NarL/FixJ family response regulator
LRTRFNFSGLKVYFAEARTCRSLPAVLVGVVVRTKIESPQAFERGALVRKFLVVEDTPAFPRSVARLLAKYGSAICARGVREADAAFTAHTDFSALIVDPHLLDGSGLEVLRKFRSSYPNHPALVLTGYSEPAAINAAYDLNADYVRKPFNAARIHQFMRTKVLSRHRRGIASAVGALTEREREVIHRARLGHDDKEIAVDRGIATSTVRVLFARAFSKTGRDLTLRTPRIGGRRRKYDRVRQTRPARRPGEVTDFGLVSHPYLTAY